MQVLIVDDNDFALDVLNDTLDRLGYTAKKARDGREALEMLREGDIRLVITDWDMPQMNGIELCRAVRREDLSGYVYIIMLTGREGAQQRMEGLCAGADDFLNKPLNPEELLVCLKTAERILSLETRDLALFALAKLAESRDPDTGSHIDRVQNYARLIAQNLSAEVKSCYGVDNEYVRLLYQTSPLHDLGKVGIPDAVLLKPGKLTPDEFEIMKTHTDIGARTLEAALQRFPNARFLQMARDIAATHHEKFDGSGYPQGLVGDQIPLSGRIVAVADVYDALSSRRVYKEAMNHEEAKAVISRDRGSQFDPEVVDAFLRAERQILEIRVRLSDEVEPSAAPTVTVLPTPEAGQAGPHPAKILVVEDDPVILAQLFKILSATGETVFKAVNGQEAMKMLAEHDPRVVISDWEMPEMDGVELCRQIRARANASPVHFIMLTAHSAKSRLLDAYRAGVNDFVPKPFDPEELLARARVGLRAAKLHDELLRKSVGSQALNAQLATMNSRLERLSITDELTGLFNRRHAMLRLDEHWSLAERYSRPLTIAMIDIDHFKKINDTYGHDIGDVILREVAAILKENTRGTDALCRVGGEEFLIIFPAQSIQEAQICAERCRAAVETHAFNTSHGTIKATISIGLAMRTRGINQFPELLKMADLGLYAAKRNGRNQLHVAEYVAEPVKEKNAMDHPDSKSNATDPAVLPAPSLPPVDLSAVLKRCGGDAKFAAAVTERFRKQAGVEVGRIAEALTGKNPEALSRAAHSLKSMAAYMGADASSELAKQIEELGRAGELDAVVPVLSCLRDEIDRAVTWITQNAPQVAA